MQPKLLLQRFILAGAFYFLCIALVHFFDIKIPGLFVYFNVPSYAYQDRIISFLAFGWAVFFWTAYVCLKQNIYIPAKYLLLAGAGAIAGLCGINMLTDFMRLSDAINPLWFWLEVGGLFLYWLCLVLLYRKSIRST